MDLRLISSAHAWLRHRLHRGQEGFAELLLIAMIAFLVGVLVSGHRVVIQ